MVWLPTRKGEVTIGMIIAGSDSIAGAGIQADIKTFVALGVHPTTVITMITAQNTTGVQEIQALPPYMVSAQIDSIISDVEIKVIKIGVLYSVEIGEAVYSKIKDLNVPIVLDPVLISQTGHSLVEDEGILGFIKKKMAPITKVITPNIDEAKALSGIEISNIDDMIEAAKKISKLGAKTVVIKGGALMGDKVIDVIYSNSEIQILENERVGEGEFHGSGCTFASAIAAHLARGYNVIEAIKMAKDFVWHALRYGLEIGKGLAIANQLSQLYKESEKERIREELWRAYRKLKEIKNIAKYVSETRMNFVYALPEPDKTEDVAAFPGRITVVNGEIYAPLKPEFGASSHVARLVLEANKFRKEIRSAINLKCSKELVERAKARGLKVFKIDREEEPEKEKEGKTMSWIIRKAVDSLGDIPDIIYDEGAKGKEPMIRILGKNPDQVVEKIAKILE